MRVIRNSIYDKRDLYYKRLVLMACFKMKYPSNLLGILGYILDLLPL